MKIKREILRISDILDLALSEKLLMSSQYSPKSWSLEKGFELINALHIGFDIGIFHLKENCGGSRCKYELIDGLQRINSIINVICGNGYYFDFEKGFFTTEKKVCYNIEIKKINGIVTYSLDKSKEYTLSQLESIHSAINFILDARIFVITYCAEMPLNEIYKQINKSYANQNTENQVIEPFGLQYIKLPILHA